MIDQTAKLSLQLRERRASIHNRSAELTHSAARRKAIAAAMQQFEEQMTAARAVTPRHEPDQSLLRGLPRQEPPGSNLEDVTALSVRVGAQCHVRQFLAMIYNCTVPCYSMLGLTA